MMAGGEELRKAEPKLTREQAFSKFATETEDGRTLFRAYRALPGAAHDGSAEPAAGISKREIEPTPSLTALNELAEKLRESEPQLTREQSFVKVYSDPANRELAMAERAERRAAAA